MSEDAILISLAIVAIALLTGVIQLTGMKWTNGQVYLRKALHFLVVLLCAYVIASIENPELLVWIFLGFTPVLLLVVKMKLLNISSGESFGIALFPLAFAILLMIDGLPRSYIVISATILAISDPLAGLIGSKYARAYWRPLDEKKSWLGSAVFFISCGLIMALCQEVNWMESDLSMGWIAIILMALLTTLSEMFSWRGSDNLFIPLIAALSMQGVMIHGATDGLLTVVIVLGLGMGLVKMGWLTVSGILAVVVMATWIVLMIGPTALVLPVLFLIFGSLLSRLNRGDKSMAKDDSHGRNAHQVFANGGIGMIMAVPYLLTHNELYLSLFTLVFTAAMSDTSSSEIGRRIKGTTWNIGTLKKVVPGESGGVSIIGTVAGLIGAMIIGGISYFIFGLPLSTVFWLTLLGFIGMIIDSFLGAFLQGKYRVHGILLEEGRQDQLVSGFHWVDNSMVNFLSVGIVVLIGYIVL